MTEQEAIGVMMTEKHCVERNIKHECDRDCVKCDLLMKDNDVLNGYDMAIKALEEIQQYRAIGTPEECSASVEKQRERKPINNDKMALWDFTCPKCGEPLIITGYEYKFCDMCGQKLDWSDNNEKL